jgi:molybdopterin-guanine dinucleotide biosynthesis adapter protein
VASRRVKRARRPVPVVAVSGPSGAGKTTLLVKLLRVLSAGGIRVAAIKHSGHPHGFDVPGKDSDLLLRAGAEAVAVAGPSQLAVFGPPRAGGVRALVRHLPPVDLVLVEGWKSARLPRIEVHRRSVDRTFLCSGERGFVAVVSDEPAPGRLPAFAPDEIERLAAFLRARFRLRGRAAGPRRAPST